MPRRKKSSYKHPTKQPYKEMQWCLRNNFKVCCSRYAEKVGRNYEEKDLYRIEVYHNGEEKFSEYKYTSENIQLEIANIYIKVYHKNHAKTEEK